MGINLLAGLGITIAVVLFIAGLLLCIKGSDLFVDAASWLGDVTGIPKGVIGATIVAFSTSAPEFFVSMFATLRGATDMAVADIVGSSAVNLGIALAAIAIIRPGTKTDKTFKFRGLMMLICALMLFGFAFMGFLSWVHGVFFLLVFVMFTVGSIRQGLKEHTPKQPTNGRDIFKNMSLFIIGLAGVLIGAHLVVDNASRLAYFFEISETIVGLTIVAVGTSLPEIVACVAGAIKKESSIAFGNVIGSGIFNIAAILAMVTFASGRLEIDPLMIYIGIPFVLGLTLITLIPILIKKQVYRWQGIAMFAVYAVFVITMIILS
jgi:cation:H+ antiporter